MQNETFISLSFCLLLLEQLKSTYTVKYCEKPQGSQESVSDKKYVFSS